MPDEENEVHDETADQPHPPLHDPVYEGEDDGDEGGEGDENPLKVPVKTAHADELVALLARYGYSELSEAFRTAEVGEVISITIVED
jgi:hypothetical protein